MRAPKIYVITKEGPESATTYETLPGDEYLHALIGRHGELRIHSSKPNTDAEIESKNLPKEVYTVLGVYSARVWESYFPDTDGDYVQ